MINNELNFILPSNNDGGGNRWSYALASLLIKKNKKLKINFLYPEFRNLSNIYQLDSAVNIKVFKSKFKSKFLVYIFFVLFLKKTIRKKTTIIISDPILSIFMFLFNKNLVIRNVASDDYNLFNFSKYRYLGILPIYKLLTYISFFYINVNFVFNSAFTFSRIYLYSKLPIQINNIDCKIIHPMIDNIYLERKKNINIKREKSIVIFPRKHSNKGFNLIHKIKNTDLFKKLNINKIYLIFNKNESFKYYLDSDYTIVHPKSDDDIIDILDKSYCFISTSFSEGFGLPPLESMSRGCVPIIIDAGGTSTYCFNGYNSLVCRNDGISLSNNIVKLFKDPKLHSELSINGINTSKNFNQEYISNLWYDYIFNNEEKNYKLNKSIINYIYSKFNNIFLIYKGTDIKIRYNLLIEIIFFPFFYLYNYIYLLFREKLHYSENKLRIKNTGIVNICLQDWSEYENIRYKKLKNGFSYKCGLTNQMIKLHSEKYHTNKYLYLTLDKISDNKNKIEDFKNINIFIKNNFKIVYSNNNYLDFSSYSDFFFKKINKDKNDILLFMNSSVSTDFNVPIIDNYVDYFNKNLDIGLFGISSNSKIYQSIILNNFNPHIQSLFFITTTNIMNEVIKMNDNVFPGLNSTKKNKYSLILNGEIKLSKIIMKLGYKIAVINEYGKVNKFRSQGFFKNRASWPNNFNDMRLNSNYPSQTKIIL